MKALQRRITHLEASMSRAHRPLTSADMALLKAFNSLIESMNPNHARIVRQEVFSLPNPGADGPRFSKLTRSAVRYLYRHLSEGTPLALPASVGAVYLDDPSAVAIHDCANCGYSVPVGCCEPFAVPPKPLRVYFQQCPLCGGAVGSGVLRKNRAVQSRDGSSPRT